MHLFVIDDSIRCNIELWRWHERGQWFDMHTQSCRVHMRHYYLYGRIVQ